MLFLHACPLGDAIYGGQPVKKCVCYQAPRELPPAMMPHLPPAPGQRRDDDDDGGGGGGGGGGGADDAQYDALAARFASLQSRS